MNFLTMDYFTALAEERNFTHAAMRLHITQQTLSAHIAALEKEVGAPLFVRHVPLELTYAGQVFYRYAVAIQKDYRSLRQTLAGVTDQEIGEIRIGTAATRERLILPDLLAAFQKQYPRIRFLLTEGSNLNLRQRLLDGQIDLAIALFGKSVPGLELHPFYKEKIVLVCPASLWEKGAPEAGLRLETKAVSDTPAWRTFLQQCPVLLNADTNIAGQTARRLFSRCGVQPDIRIESNNLETLLSLCVLGTGAMFSPDNLVARLLQPGEARRVRIFGLPDASYTISFGCKRHRDRWIMLDKFMEFARKEMQPVV
ncbi:MAG: LysR family transcriptional regulator [Succiniclasticum sp.]|jgi:DNA-binding transcriptional LysR family regulator|nr:LysR family transcriptional regulator [Succiniclasticum sp.]MEE3479201.1 LysR family transcriptional regulator [Succiniclasticum sp.]